VNFCTSEKQFSKKSSKHGAGTCPQCALHRSVPIVEHHYELWKIFYKFFLLDPYQNKSVILLFRTFTPSNLNYKSFWKKNRQKLWIVLQYQWSINVNFPIISLTIYYFLLFQFFNLSFSYHLLKKKLYNNS